MRYKKLWDTARSLFLYFRSPYLSIHLLCILNHLRPYCPLSGQVHNRLQGTSAGKTHSSSSSLLAQVATYGTMTTISKWLQKLPITISAQRESSLRNGGFFCWNSFFCCIFTDLVPPTGRDDSEEQSGDSDKGHICQVRYILQLFFIHDTQSTFRFQTFKMQNEAHHLNKKVLIVPLEHLHPSSQTQFSPYYT